MGIRLDDPLIEGRARSSAHRGLARLERAAAVPGARVATAAGENPFCGDELEMRLVMRPGATGAWRIEDVAFDGYGCTLCLAAADAVAEYACGREAAEASALGFEGLCGLLGGLEVGRTRRGCAELPLRVMRQALQELEGSAGGEKAGPAGKEPVDRRSWALA